jgi:hypothetical protein
MSTVVTLPEVAPTTEPTPTTRKRRDRTTNTPKWTFYTFDGTNLASYTDKAALVAAVAKIGATCRVFHGHEMQVTTKVALELKR